MDRKRSAAAVGARAVSDEDGRFLRMTVASSRAIRAVEIGGASGYSAIWIGLGLRETGGRLTDPALFTTIVTPSGEGMAV